MAVLLAAALIRFFSLGSYPLMDTTEGRYATIAQQMVLTGDWVTPRLLDGEPFLGKPPLSFWLSAVSIRIFGESEFAVRFPSFLLAAGMLLLTFLLGRRLTGARIALGASTVLMTSTLFFIMAGGVLTDPSLAATVTLSLAAFPLCVLSHNPTAQKLWGYTFFIGMGLSLLAKGPVGVVLIALPVVGWTIWNGRLREVWQALPVTGGLLLTAAIAVPWHLIAELANPGFLDYYLIGEHWKRFTEPGWSGDRYGNPHEYPRGTIWLFGLAAGLPWTLILLVSSLWLLKRGVRPASPWVGYLILWIATPLLFFTPSRNVIITYVLPGLPAGALLTALALHATVREIAKIAHRLKVGRRSLRPWWLRRGPVFGSLALVPVVSGVMFLFFLPTSAAQRSQLRIVEAFSYHDYDEDADLVYFGNQPYSSEFYTSGVAEKIEFGSQELKGTLNDGDQDFYVVHRRNLEEFLLIARPHVDIVGTYGKYTLAREPDTGDRK